MKTLINPVVQSLSLHDLTDRYARTGYEVEIDNTIVALRPAWDSIIMRAELGEIVEVLAVGPGKRGRVVRRLKGYRSVYQDQRLP